MNAKYIEASAQEIRRGGGLKWAVGVYLNLPIDYPLDHPDLHPLWQAMDEHGLCYIHHSFGEGYPMGAQAAAPLLAGDELLGVLGVNFRAPRRFSLEEMPKRRLCMPEQMLIRSTTRLPFSISCWRSCLNLRGRSPSH